MRVIFRRYRIDDAVGHILEHRPRKVGRLLVLGGWLGVSVA
jgi:hypothetical protein